MVLLVLVPTLGMMTLLDLGLKVVGLSRGGAVVGPSEMVVRIASSARLTSTPRVRAASGRFGDEAGRRRLPTRTGRGAWACCCCPSEAPGNVVSLL